MIAWSSPSTRPLTLTRHTHAVHPSPELSDIEAFVRGTFSEAILRSLHPRTQIEITIQVLEDDGAILSTAINATTLALVNAGIPMRAMVVACSAAFVPQRGAAALSAVSPFSSAAKPHDEEESLLVLNPTLEQRAAARACFTIAFDSSLRDILATRCSGSFSEHELAHTIESCREQCSEILTFIRQTLDAIE